MQKTNYRKGVLKAHSYQLAAIHGFTLIELLIASAVGVVILTTGVAIGAGQFQTYSLRTERDVVVSMLERARARAMSNVDQANHGFSVQAANFVIFEGNSYAARIAANDQIVPRSGFVTASGVSEVVFSELSGNASASGDLILATGSGSRTININNEGRISY